jgi:hypothetical protein
MDNFIIEEFEFYKVVLHSDTANEGIDCGIHIKLPSGAAYLRYSKNNTRKNNVVKKGNFYDFNCYMVLEKYPMHIDILRNEKPLFFFYNLDTNKAYITTSDEPVGEEESSDD